MHIMTYITQTIFQADYRVMKVITNLFCHVDWCVLCPRANGYFYTEPIDNSARMFTPGETKSLGTSHYLWRGGGKK